jgi:hypothetical protein
MTATHPLLERDSVGNPHHDNSGLRARLSGQIVECRSIEAELQAAVRQRESADITVDVGTNDRWR